MANTFETTVAALVENRLASEHPNLVQYRRGFLLLDFDEEEQKAFGVYRMLIGSVPALMPIVYRKGELSGMDIIILRDLKMYVPAIDGWINLVATSGSQELGELMPDKGKGKTPSQVNLRLREFPYLIRTAKSQLTTAEYEALCEPLQMIDAKAAELAFHKNMAEEWLLKDAHGAAMVAKAASSYPKFADAFTRVHGDEMLALVMKKAESFDLPPNRLLKKASPQLSQKLTIIRDIGSAEARALKSSEKRLLLKHGQYVVDHRAESETSLVYRSPEGQHFQTCPGAGRWKLLTSTGDLVHVETCLEENIGDHNYPKGCSDSCIPTIPSEVDAESSDVWVIPTDGSKSFKHMRKELYVRPASITQEEWPLKGTAASKSAVRQLLLDREAKRKADSKKDSALPAYPSSDTLYGTFMVVGNGRAFQASMDIPRTEDKSPITACGKQLIFTGTPGKIRVLEDRVMIPSTARLFLDDYGAQSLSLGRPSDITGKIIREEGAKELSVRLAGPLYDMTGAINKHARPENDALLDLVQLGGIQASVAAGLLRDAAQHPGETHKYLVKFAAPDPTEDNALAGITFAPTQQTNYQGMDPSQLAQQGKSVASAVAGKPDDMVDKKMMETVMNMTSFREITADTVRQCTSTMDEMGKLLLRVLLHKDEYENRYGQEDAERLEVKCRETFFSDGDMALFLREKRGSQGMQNDEGLADMLSQDMGNAGSSGSMQA